MADNRYESSNDVHMRLDGTYIKYKDEVYLCSHSGDLDVILYDISKRNIVQFGTVSANDPDLDISSVPLGYCNIREAAPVYLVREAARRQKQGVHSHFIVGFSETHRKWLRPPGKSLNISHLEYYKTIKGDYPSISDILNDNKYTQGGAFHRRLALIPFTSGRWKLKYMTNFVGLLRASDMSIHLVRSQRGNSFLLNALAMRGVTIND